MDNTDDVEFLKDGRVAISGKKYLQLLWDEMNLHALQSGGVDNWDWYDVSLEQADSSAYDQAKEMIRIESHA